MAVRKDRCSFLTISRKNREIVECVQSNDNNSMETFFFADYENFCQILLQRPFAWGSAGMLFTTRVTEEDLAIMTKLAQGHFYKVITILKQLPRSMLLVFRWGRSSPSGVFLRHNPLSPKNDQNQFSPFNINKQPRKRLWELLKWPQERDCFHWSLNRLSIRPSLGVRGEEFFFWGGGGEGGGGGLGPLFSSSHPPPPPLLSSNAWYLG